MGRRTHSSVLDTLPDDVREELDRRLAGGEPYRDSSSWLESQGYEVSKSTVCRYWLANGRELAEIVRMSRVLGAQLTEGGGRPATELHETANLYLTDRLVQMTLELERDDGHSVATLSEITRALSSLQRSAIYNERVKARQVEQFDVASRKLTEEFHRLLQDSHPELLDKLLGVLTAEREELAG